MKKRLSGALLFAAAFQMMVGLADAALYVGYTGEGFEPGRALSPTKPRPMARPADKAISALMGTKLFVGDHRG